MEKAKEILLFWFGSLDANIAHEEYVKKWFESSEYDDMEIRERFEDDYENAVAGEYENWNETPEGSLALVILMDQFPRNMYRDTERAYASDEKALEICLEAIEKEQNLELTLLQQVFLYMPLMHSEELEMHDMAEQYFEQLLYEAGKENNPSIAFFQSVYDYELKHLEILERFGRYPHRNDALQRQSTPQELDFLDSEENVFK